MPFRTFLETAVAQKSKNIDFMMEHSLVANRKNLWVLMKVLEKHTALKKNNYKAIVNFYGSTNLLRPKYASMLDS